MNTSTEEFLAHRCRQESQTITATDDASNPLRSLMTVELNTTELCNRKCVFCPRVDPDIYPNRGLHLSVVYASKVADDLAKFGFVGRISFSGFGEPVLNRSFPDLVSSVRHRLPCNQIDTNTNGDKLTVEIVAGLYEAGLTHMYVNMYDGPEQRAYFHDLFAAAGIPQDRYRLRPHWPGLDEHFGLILNNRSGLVVDTALGLPVISHALELPCYYPFSHAMIDWNGDMLLCSNDWGRALIAGNVIERNFAEVWMSDAMLHVRRRLMSGDRNHAPCATCSVNGTLTGQYGFDLLISYYKQHGLVEKSFIADTSGEPSQC